MKKIWAETIILVRAAISEMSFAEKPGVKKVHSFSEKIKTKTSNIKNIAKLKLMQMLANVFDSSPFPSTTSLVKTGIKAEERAPMTRT